MIPLLNANDQNFDTDFLQACRTIGFVAIESHDVSLQLIRDMRQMLMRLFALSDEHKAQYQITRDNYRGFIPLGFFTPNRSEVNGAEPDRYEGFKLHWECPAGHPARSESHLYGANRWVPQIDNMRALVLEYWTACDRLAARLMDVVATHLGVAPSDMRSWLHAPLTNMTLLHYPPQPSAENATGIHPHKDTNVITFLHPDPVGGLEVRGTNGEWIQAAPPAHALLVNIGEMLELWSGGEFVATPHRVINRGNNDRYSFPWFLAPNHKVTVEPLVDCVPDYQPSRMPVGELSAEVWRTNWADERPADVNFDLGSLDR